MKWRWIYTLNGNVDYSSITEVVIISSYTDMIYGGHLHSKALFSSENLKNTFILETISLHTD